MKLKIALISLLVVSSLSSQNIGTGLTFLKLGVGARSVAMGEASTAIVNGSPSIFYNPAVSRFDDRNEISLMHKQWIAETSVDYLGTVLPADAITYSLSALTSSIGGIEARTQPGPAEETFSAKNFAFTFGMSFFVADNFAVGASGKFLYEKIFVDEANGYGVDLGGLYKIDEHLSSGVSLLNLGSMSILKNEASKLPTTVRAGLAYASSLTDQIRYTGAVDFLKTIDDSINHIHVGAEATYDSTIAVRMGYQTGYESKSISAGFGVTYGIVTFDYAFVPFTGALNTTHTFSLSFLL